MGDGPAQFGVALGVGVLGLGAAAGFIGGLVKNPWAKREASPLWHTGWSPYWNS
ncbi:hypothetical protein PJI74_30560, partial [Mycobacterium kansasii]